MKNSKRAYKILVVDDEPDVLELLQYKLEQEGYVVRTAGDGRQGVEEAKTFLPDMILLDIMMPVQDGIETCLQLRALPELQEVCVIFLTARTEEYAEIAAFEAGADGYITKPVKPRALMRRINAIFRRRAEKENSSNRINIRNLVIDKVSFRVNVGLGQVKLARKEFELLCLMAEHPEKIYSRQELLKNIWGDEVGVMVRTIDVHIRKVREKIGEGYITTVNGIGYKFELKQ